MEQVLQTCIQKLRTPSCFFKPDSKTENSELLLNRGGMVPLLETRAQPGLAWTCQLCVVQNELQNPDQQSADNLNK
jgi:hypothetical protein